MASTLPKSVSLKVSQALGQWQHWQVTDTLSSRPEIVTVLGQGLSNFSVQVANEEKSFVVRVDGVTPALHGINRQLEWRALNNAADAGLAPKPRYFNPDLGVLVCDYLQPDSNQKQDIGDIAALARAIHALPALHHRLDLRERITRYEKLASQHGGALFQRVLQSRSHIRGLLDGFSDSSSERVCCHNDLLAANRLLSAGKIWALDWEYCAMGSPWFDLAVVACGEDYQDAEIEAFALAYLRRPALSEELTQFRCHISVYRYLELLWHLGQTKESGEAHEDLERKCNALERVRGYTD